MVADEELDELYGSRPEDFTALRTELAAAAKRRGDTAANKRISAARRPTTAAWIVNMLVRRNEDTRHALTDLGERMRNAHGAMDGVRIRELSAEQRRLVDELARAAFESAELPAPTSALRDDVTGTLQAAIADPELAARLGQLDKAERWSGFGEFVETAPVSSAAKTTAVKATGVTTTKAPSARDQATEALAAAQRAKDASDGTVADLQKQVSAAEERRAEARRQLDNAESEFASARADLETARSANADVAEVVRQASTRLDELAKSPDDA